MINDCWYQPKHEMLHVYFIVAMKAFVNYTGMTQLKAETFFNVLIFKMVLAASTCKNDTLNLVTVF